MDEEYPTAALEFMQRQHLNGRIFNQDRWGGYMEWVTPDIASPIIDGRTDIFVENGTFDDYVNAILIQVTASKFWISTRSTMSCCSRPSL